MKKAGIITHYNVHNHGAHLQLYALSQILNEFGYDAKALRFNKNYDFMGESKIDKKYNISIWSIPIYIKYTIDNGIDRTLYNIFKRRKLSTFRKQHRLIGDFYSNANDLDIVVIGSDEIFSIEAGPNPWYYGIGVPCSNQISYAASFGPTTQDMIYDHNMESLIKSGLDNINYISVRDQNSADIVRTFSDKIPTIVCDPVLLYSFPNQINKKNIVRFRKKHPEKYCIVYSYDYNMNDVKTIKSIKKYAKKNGLKIYSVGYFHRWCDKNINLDPLDVFNWFSCAEIVFTDTFHGTVISIETGTQFISMIRGNGNKLEYLLEQYGLKERITKDFNNIEKYSNNPIDYKIINKTKQRIRDDSMNFLKSSIDSF